MRFFSSGNQAKSPGAPSLQSPCVMLAGGLTLPGDGPVPTQGLSPLGANPALLLPSDIFGSGAAGAARQDPVPLELAKQRRLLVPCLWPPSGAEDTGKLHFIYQK